MGIKAGTANAGLYVNDDRWFQYLSPEMQASHTYNADAGQLALLDWQDKMFRSAAIQNYDVSVQGGTDNLSYLVSGGYMKRTDSSSAPITSASLSVRKSRAR